MSSSSSRKRRKRRSAPESIKLIVLLLLLLLLAVKPAHSSADPYSGLAADDDEQPPPPSSNSRSSRKKLVSIDDDEQIEDAEEGREFGSGSSVGSKLRKTSDGPSLKSNQRQSVSASAGSDSLSSGSESLFIHLVPHSHIDHGWLRTVDGYEDTVQAILSSVTQQLDVDIKRKFVWSETWYFRRWFESLGSGKREKVKRLVKEGRFEFVGGGLLMHDENLASERLIVEQIQEGHTFLDQTFGILPKIAWQIDSPGHSDSTPGLLSRLGYSVVVINRVHFRLKQRFRKGQHLEFVWRGTKLGSSDALRTSAKDSKAADRENADEAHQIFAHLLPMSYASPDGNDFEKTGTRQVTAPRGRAAKLLQYARDLSRSFRTHHVMIPWGDDLRFREADKQYANMDKIIAEIAAENPTIRIQYSTASEYFESLQRASVSSSLRFPLYLGDFATYADSGDAYWTGAFSTRPLLKRWAKQLESRVYTASTFYSLARARAALYGNIPRVSSIEIESGRVVADDARPASSWGVGLHRSLLFARRQAMLIGAHHHSITGNSKEAVIKDYLKRAKLGSESAMRVAAEALSYLVAKRKVDYRAVGPHVRPPLKPWTSQDALDLKEDGRHWPLLFTNEGNQWRREVLAIRLACTWAVAKRAKVVDGLGGPIPSQIHKSLASSNVGDEGGWRADTHLFIYVEVPPLGFTTYFVSSSTNAERLASVTQQATSAIVQIQVYDMLNGRIVPSVNAPSAEAMEGIKVMTMTPGNAPDTRTNQNGACLLIDNDVLSAEMDCETSLLKAITNKRSKKRILLRQEYRVHESTRGGAVLFRPDRLESTQLQIGDRGRLTVAIVRGPLVQEVQILADGVSQTIRLLRAPHGIDAHSALSLEGHLAVSQAVAGTTPDVDTVVRYTTDLKTGGAFFTDNPAGTLRERKAQPDAPLAANFFSCSSSLLIKSPTTVLGIVSSQALGCSGAASVAAGGGDHGVVELVLHRNPTADDGRGLGEGLSDFGVSRLDSVIFFDQVEAAITRRQNLVYRFSQIGEIGIMQMEYTALLNLFLNRDVWVSRFVTSSSFLKKNALPADIRILSVMPRDEVSDEVSIRIEYLGDTVAKLDWADIFNSEEVIVAGVRELSRPPAKDVAFQCSDRPDDFHAAGLDGDGSASYNQAGYQLSEHALKEINGETEESTLSASARSSQATAVVRKLAQNSNAKEGGVPAGSALPTAPILDEKWRAASLPVEFRRGDLRTFSVTLLALPDERLPKKASAPGSVNSGAVPDGRRKLTLPPSNTAEKGSVGSPTDVARGGTLSAAQGSPTSPHKLTAKTSASGSTVDELSRFVDDTTTLLAKNKADAESKVSESTNNARTDSSSLRTLDHRGKSITSLRGDLIAEEKRSAALEIRSKRLQQNVDELLQELELFQDIDGGLDKKAALEELARAEEQLVEGNLLLAESKEKVLALQRELDHMEALDELRNRHPHKRRGEGDRNDSSGTLHGFFAGAGGMLVIMIAAQWLFTGRRRHHQAYVPVRYVPVNHNGASFALPVKRL